MKTGPSPTFPRRSWSPSAALTAGLLALAACGGGGSGGEGGTGTSGGEGGNAPCSRCEPELEAGAPRTETEAGAGAGAGPGTSDAAVSPGPDVATPTGSAGDAAVAARPDASPGPGTTADAAVLIPPSNDVIGPLRMPVTTTHLATSAHDPAMIQSNGTYYLFATGGNLAMRTSTNLIDWRAAGNVLSGSPSWLAATGVTPTNGFWAPDVSFFGGKFRVYYAASTFGNNHSAIGQASNVTLDPASPDYKWVDEGLTIQSVNTDRWNAIDPNVVLDAEGQPWMAFGSFWDGIKMRKLDAATGQLSATDVALYTLATRPNGSNATGGALEAPSIVFAHGWYYLLVSYDLCCKGISSTYRTMAGRSRVVTGPYVDPTNVSMAAGGAVQLLATSGRYIGPGGGTIIRDKNQLLYVHHYYDGMSNGRSTLEIHPLALDANDWLVVGEPLWP